MGIVELVIALAILAIVAVLLQYFASQIGLPPVVVQVLNIILVAAFVIVVVKALLPLLGSI